MDELIPFVIYPGTKLLAQQGIESIMYPEQQQRPLPSLLSSSFFYGMGLSFGKLIKRVVHFRTVGF